MNFELTWSQEYEIGHPVIDQQHAKLFELYNMIAEAFSAGLGHEVVAPALRELVAYTRYHFAEEEALMERLGCRHIITHRREHRRLITEVSALAADFADGQPVLLYELLSLVKNWLSDHILSEDMKLRELMEAW
ncbi:bacteriohemerythrin [Motiliproteus sediminis]|uniref:bacteriohemerythrin n=1 Tax=Motiliproteus sediminis TaxID=1468178 RepID=UPI001AEF96F2